MAVVDLTPYAIHKSYEYHFIRYVCTTLEFQHTVYNENRIEHNIFYNLPNNSIYPPYEFLYIQSKN